MPNDYYPSSMDARSAWHANLAKQLPAFVTKYLIPAPTVAQLLADAEWIIYWVAFRNSFDASSQQLTKFFNSIAGRDDSVEAPLAFTIDPPDTPPTQVPPGIEKRVRDLASFVKGNRAVYSEADGEALGIVAAEESQEVLDNIYPVFELSTQAEFKLKADFRKRNLDGIRFEYRHMGGKWFPAGVLLNSGGKFTVAPSEPGVAEQVEIRGIYLKGNDDIYNFSPAMSAFIAP